MNNDKGKQIKIGSSMRLNNSNLTLPSGTTTFSLLKDSIGAEVLVAKSSIITRQSAIHDWRYKVVFRWYC